MFGSEEYSGSVPDCRFAEHSGINTITEAYTKLAHKKVPGDPKGRTYAELIAEGQYTAAGKGKTEAAREIADRLEGKAVQPIVGITLPVRA